MVVHVALLGIPPIDMYIRETRQKRADGSILTHVQLVRSQWDPAKKRSVTKVVAGFGRADDPETLARLKRLATSILRRTDPEAMAVQPGWKLLDAWPYGPLYVLEALWRDKVVSEAIVLRRKVD